MIMDGCDRSALLERIEEDLEKILGSAFCTMDEYEELVASGVLVRRGILEGDREFESRYPHHPLAATNRFNRISAADDILGCTEKLRGEVPESLLPKLHEVLFDCSAAVRDSITRALFQIGSPLSIPYLEALIERKKYSETVLENARTALARCRMKERVTVRPGERLIMLVSGRIDLARTLLDAAEKMGCSLYIPEPDCTELLVWKSEVQVIDRFYMGEEAWEMLCDFLEDVNKDSPDDYPLRGEDGEILLEEPLYDTTLIIIIDSNITKSRRMFPDPLKPSGSQVFWVEGV